MKNSDSHGLGRKVLTGAVTLSLCATFGTGAASASTSTGTTSPAAGISPADAMPTGSLRATDDTYVVEVRDSSGTVIGYSVDPEVQANLSSLALQLGHQNGLSGNAAETDDFFQVAQCVGAVSAFIALTVFPTARAAKVAVSLGKLVSKYGVQKTAQILTRTYKGNDIDAQQIFLDFAKEAAGIGALSVCFNPI